MACASKTRFAESRVPRNPDRCHVTSLPLAARLLRVRNRSGCGVPARWSRAPVLVATIQRFHRGLCRLSHARQLRDAEPLAEALELGVVVRIGGVEVFAFGD